MSGIERLAEASITSLPVACAPVNRDFLMLSNVHARHAWDEINACHPRDRPFFVQSLFMLMIAHTSHKKAPCSLNRVQLAEKMGCRPDQISAAVRVLVTCDLVEVSQRKVKGKRGLPERVYTVTGWVAGSANPRVAAERREGFSEPGSKPLCTAELLDELQKAELGFSS